MTHIFTGQLARTGPWWKVSVEGVQGTWEFRKRDDVEPKARWLCAMLHGLDTSEVVLDLHCEEDQQLRSDTASDPGQEPKNPA